MSRHSSRLILLDAAGTLIHPAEPVENVYARYFSQFGWITPTPDLRSSFRETFSSLADPEFAAHPDGDAAERAWWRQVVEKTARAVGIHATGPEFDACFHALFDHYAQPSAWSVYPEVPPLLARLRADGWHLAVVSNFDRRLHHVLAGLDLPDSFDLVLTSADVSARKPSPLLLQKAIAAPPSKSHRRLPTGRNPSATWAIAIMPMPVPPRPQAFPASSSTARKPAWKICLNG